MARSKSDSSAARKNTSPSRVNDMPDSELLARVFSTAGHGQKTAVLLEKVGGMFISQQVANALALSAASPTTWQAFIEDDFWSVHTKQRPTAGDQQNAPRFVLRIYFSEKESGDKRANEVWTAIQQLMRENLTPVQIVDEFEKGLGTKGMNLRAVCRRAAEVKQASKPAPKQARPHQVPQTKSKARAASPSPKKPFSKASPPIAMDSLKLFFPKGLGDYGNHVKGVVIAQTIRILDVAPHGYTAEFIKMKRKSN